MKNKEFEQTGRQNAWDLNSLGQFNAHQWKQSQEREEELKLISPVLHQINSQNPPDISSAQWKEFSQKVDVALRQHKSPVFRTLRDRIKSSDHNLVRIFWLVIAFVIVACAALSLAVSLHIIPLRKADWGVASIPSSAPATHTSLDPSTKDTLFTSFQA